MSDRVEDNPPCLSPPSPGENNGSTVVMTGDPSSRNIVEKTKKIAGKVKQKNYVLNDVGALKKKLKHENKKQEISIGKEAKDASNITVPMRASFFEFVKSHFIQDIENNEDIVNIENAEGAKAATENFGDAYVEYSMDITFKVKDLTHTVKLTAYTTSSQIMVQPMGEKAGIKDHLGSRGTPRFFVETFLLPWSERCIKEKRFNETIQKMYIAAIKEEIKKLDLLKFEMKKSSKNSIDLSSSESGNISLRGEAKCCAKNCNFQGLNPHNKAAVGTCANCGNFEHFACVKIRSEHKEDITKGTMLYYCSTCFSKNPSNPAKKIMSIRNEEELVPKPRHRLDSLPVMGNGYLPTVPRSIKVTAITQEQVNNKKKCIYCDYETESLQEMRAHLEQNHKPKCTKCERVFPSSQELQEHIEADHNVGCNHCDIKFLDKQTLEKHIQESHTYRCNFCSSAFNSILNLNTHVESTHNYKCKTCEGSFNEKNELEKHVEECHSQECQECTYVTEKVCSLETQTNDEHTHPCPHCESKFSNEDEMKKHVEEKHAPQLNPCSQSDETVTVTAELRKHSLEQNKEDETPANKDIVYCAICKINFTSSPELEIHIEDEHKQKCETCDDAFTTRSMLKSHVKEKHSFKCIYCEKVTSTQKNMEDHVAAEHTIMCNLCSFILGTESELELHRTDKHPNACVVCSKELGNKSDLDKHIEENHTYTCDICGYIAINEDVMENHILDRHARPDEDGEFKCDDCEFKTRDKQQFGKHFKDSHGSNSNKNETEATKLKDNFRILKNNFDRLEMMYHDALEEVKTVKAEFETRLLKATDMYAAAKAEKEVLEEKVDVLFKLGRSYINAKQNGTHDERAENSIGKDSDEILEIVEVHRNNENDDEHEDDLGGWTKNKMRGFKRVNPATNPQLNSGGKGVTNSNKQNMPWNSADRQSHTQGSGGRPHPGSPAPAVGQISPLRHSRPGPSDKESAANQKNHENRTNHENMHSARYCHFFVNQGRCTFEERTGSKCKFLHKMAPMCNSGISCSRKKCMYSHPKTPPSRTFLGQNMMMNPWQMINPWIQDHQNQFFPQWRQNLAQRNI